MEDVGEGSAGCEVGLRTEREGSTACERRSDGAHGMCRSVRRPNAGMRCLEGGVEWEKKK